MARLTDGFDHYYRPVKDRIEAAFEDGLIVVDTNVLLHVLRYSPLAREELLAVLGEIKNQLFIPYQIALEFNRNRVDVVDQRRTELEQTEAEIDKLRSATRALINAFANRRTLHPSDIEGLEAARSNLFDVLDSAQTEADNSYDLNPDKMVGYKDELTARLELIIGDQVGARPSDQLLLADAAEAERRHEAQLAPGFKDKSDGDYLWWAEVLRAPELQNRAVVVVSDDAAKGDWLFKQRKLNAGPHSILVEDVRGAGGTDLILLTTRDLLLLVQSRDPEKVSTTTLDESEDALNPSPATWTAAAYEQLLATLRSTGNGERADVIVEAARADGFISRSSLYEIIKQDEDARSLRHFATPARNAMSALVADGLVSKQAQEPMRAEYTGPGKAIGYSVPEEFVKYEASSGPTTDSAIGFAVSTIEGPDGTVA
ncbi:PIN-like domain-containing protein [Clavibacter sp. km1a]|uniref:PIN-like domain-containing protein n=1 Tax=Clavibacter sp. km1a TaxID=3459136 RepID=UPI004041B33D